MGIALPQLEPEMNHVAIHAPHTAPSTAPPPHPVLYGGPPQETGVPPLIHVSQGSQNIVTVSDPWNVVDQSATFVRPVISLGCPQQRVLGRSHGKLQ